MFLIRFLLFLSLSLSCCVFQFTSGLTGGLAYCASSIASPLSKTQNWTDWQEAKRHYDLQQFGEALQEFQNHPKEDASYYYNLGTLYFRLNQLGAAVAHLEKANRMNPHDPDIQYNLSMTRSALGQLIGPENLDPASNWGEKMADRVSLNEVEAVLGLLALSLVLLWFRAYSKIRKIKPTLMSPAGILGAAALGIAITLYSVEKWAGSSPPAVSLERQTIRSGPGENYLNLSEIEAGTKLRLLGVSKSATTPNPSTSDIWQQVRYSPEGIGWVKSSRLLVI